MAVPQAPTGLVVYTVVIGDGYRLPPLPGGGMTAGGESLFLCFTDRADLTGEGWTIVPIDPSLPGDEVRSARDIKIRPHRWLPSAEWRVGPLPLRSLYIDPRVVLTADPETVWRTLIGTGQGVLVGALLHSFRATVADEFDACVEQGLENPLTLSEHRRALCDHDPAALTERPVWGGMLARRHADPAVIDAMEGWFAQVLRYSRRDQLSFASVARVLDEGQLRLAESDIHVSAFHRWPLTSYARPERYAASARDRFPEHTEALLLLARTRQELEHSQDSLRRLRERRIVRFALAVARPMRGLFRSLRHLNDRLSQASRLLERRAAAYLWALRERRRFRQVPPQTYAEKIRARMVLVRDPLLRTFADKVATAEYVAMTVGREHVPTRYGLYDRSSAVPLDDLPARCVIKPTHASGAVIALDERAPRPGRLPLPPAGHPWFPLRIRIPAAALDRDWFRLISDHWLHRDYAAAHGRLEWAYQGVPRRLLVEELLDDGTDDFPQDCKLFVFHGRVGLILTQGNRGRTDQFRTYYDREGREVMLRPEGFTGLRRPGSLPDVFPQMVSIAEALARPVDFLRVDLYRIGDRILVGELTNYPAAGDKELLLPDGSIWTAPDW